MHKIAQNGDRQAGMSSGFRKAFGLGDTEEVSRQTEIAKLRLTERRKQTDAVGRFLARSRWSSAQVHAAIK